MLSRGAGDTMTERGLQQSWKIVAARIDGEIVGCSFLALYERPKGRCLYVTGIAGFGVPRWQDAMFDFHDLIAQQQGCYCMETKARVGSAVELKTRGWRQKAIVMEKSYGR